VAWFDQRVSALKKFMVYKLSVIDCAPIAMLQILCKHGNRSIISSVFHEIKILFLSYDENLGHVFVCASDFMYGSDMAVLVCFDCMNKLFKGAKD